MVRYQRSFGARLSAVLVAGGLVAVGIAGTGGPVAAVAPVTVTRFSGATRYETAKLTALSAFPAGATDVLLARGDLFPDALAGSFMAGAVTGPILLTTSDTLDPQAQAGLAALHAHKVHLLGGTSAVSDTVKNQLVALGYAVDRFGGDSRYATAAIIAQSQGAAGVGSLGSNGKTAIVASGEAFPDALAGGPVSYFGKFPTLLTTAAGLSPEASSALDALAIKHVLLLGGPVAVTDTVKTSIEAKGITVQRIFGNDRYETAAAIADFARTTLAWTISSLVLTVGTNFPDAVASGPLGGKNTAPVVLATDPLPASSLGECTVNQPTLHGLFVEGGTTVLPDPPVNQCQAAAAGSPPPPPVNRSGYVWANLPTTASYSPSSIYQANSTGATNTITRSGIGTYNVDFPGLDGIGGTVDVTAYGGGSQVCKVVNWGPTGSDQHVNVQCYDNAGAPADVAFTALYTRPLPATTGLGFVWLDDPTGASSTPSATYSYNATGGTNTATRSGAGVYTVTLPGLGVPGGTVKVTAYGSGSTNCKVDFWVPSGSNESVTVLCFDATGAAADSRFTMTFANNAALAPIGTKVGYVWGNLSGTASYAPSGAYSFNSSGGANMVTRSATGTYQVSLPGLAPPAGGDVQVTAYGPGGNRCAVTSWGASGVTVNVNCHTPAGALVDAQYVVQFLG